MTKTTGLSVIVLILCVFIAMSTLANAARIYKCVDNNGRVIVTDNPPQDTTCEDWGAAPVRSGQEDRKSKKVYTGSKVNIDVVDIDIKSIFRMLSEVGKVKIVSGEDVKGTVTLKMISVPWDEALDTILDLKGLDKRQEGKTITRFSRENLI